MVQHPRPRCDNREHVAVIQHPPSRRQVARAAAWTAPVVLAAAAAPDAAASPFPCPAILTDTSTTTTNGFTNMGQTYQHSQWDGPEFWMDVDEYRGTGSQVGVLTNTSPVTVVAGYRYTIRIRAKAQYGYAGSGTCTTYNTNAEVVFLQPGATAGTSIWTGSTQSSGGGTVVQPPGRCTGTSSTQRSFGFGYQGVLDTYYTTTITVTASASGTAGIALRFTMANDGLIVGSNNCNGSTRPCNGTNDDWRIGVSLVACETNW